MKIAIIGAGFTGLAAAYTLLQKGHDVSIFEKDKNPGGLALGYSHVGWKWTLEEYYHHWFTNDNAVLRLAKQLNYPVIIKRPKTSVYVDGEIFQLDSPVKLLQFPKLPLTQRLRMAAVLALLRFDPFWKPFETVKASAILPKAMGKKAYEVIWEPQLRNKFGEFTNDISLAWFWARIVKRTPSLAYPQGGFLEFALSLVKHIEQLNGKIFFEKGIDNLLEKNGKILLSGVNDTFDRAIVTLPSFAFLKMAPQLPEAYTKKLTPLKGLGAMTLVLRLKKQFFTDNTYWLSVCQNNSPITAIVEHTNFMDGSFYNNEHIVYLGNYLPMGHKYFSMNATQLLKEFDPLLSKINKDYRKNIIGTDLFTVPFAQPIIPINYSKMIPPHTTPIKNVFLANIQQVYPWDRGTNYAVELGEKIANSLQ